MRESKILKAFSYCLIPFLILCISLSVFYEFGKNAFAQEKDNKAYFKTNEFLEIYMHGLSESVNRLIYYNQRYNSVYDGNIRICYADEYDDYYYGYEKNVKDNFYLIQYKDLAFTNVELTSQTDSIEEIKNFVNNSENKKMNIINGIVEADSELFTNKAIKFFENFENTYYSVIENNKTKYVVKKQGDSQVWITENGTYSYYPEENVEFEIVDRANLEETTEENQENPEKNVEWYTTTIRDFLIYSSYKEELIARQSDMYIQKLIEDLKPYESIMLNSIPVTSILLVIILVYLIVAIGHTKGKEGIDFNDLDKIPIEIILLVGGTIVVLIGGLCITSLDSLNVEYYKFANTLLLTGYFICYILCAIMTVTTIKKIKSKNLIKDSLTGRFCIWSWNLCKKILNKIKVLIKRVLTTIKELIKNWPDAIKAAAFFVIYVIVSVFVIFAFNFIGFLAILIVTGILLYGILEEINSYRKIEKHLKEMYEGNHTKKLDEKEFTKNFKDMVKYINDVSRGFENAIEEGIKSERLKTELITNVSHDIKTPLTSIINYVDLLKKENIENEKIKEYIDVLDNKSQRLKKLTEDLVEASKASSGNVKLNIEKINVVELIKQSTGEFEDKFKAKELDVISEFAEEEMYINADNRYMYRIIENLFSNISKYAQDKSRVYIDIKRVGSKAKIAIKNISKERLNISSDELMQRFVRGDKSRTTEGSGLGLSISRSLTELQKGTFDIQIDGDLFKVELEFDII